MHLDILASFANTLSLAEAFQPSQAFMRRVLHKTEEIEESLQVLSVKSWMSVEEVLKHEALAVYRCKRILLVWQFFNLTGIVSFLAKLQFLHKDFMTLLPVMNEVRAPCYVILKGITRPFSCWLCHPFKECLDFLSTKAHSYAVLVFEDSTELLSISEGTIRGFFIVVRLVNVHISR